MIKLLIVDDSPLMRRLLGDLFKAEGDFELAVAKDGVQALALLGEFRPDVVTLDVQMPGMNGLECLDRIMVERPTPVVIASSVTVEGAEEALRALELGAVDIMAKPGGAISLRMDRFGPALVEKVRVAARARLPKSTRLVDRVAARAGRLSPARRSTPPALKTPELHQSPRSERIVIVGCSTGGPQALDALLEPLPADFPQPILVAQHMPAAFTASLSRRLDGLTDLSVVEVRTPTQLEAGVVYVAAGDADMVVSRRAGALTALSIPSSDAFRWHPSVDRLVDSALDHLPGERITGVLMTGMGNDGAAAMTRLREAGGRTVAEAEETAVVWGMPGELVRAGGATLTRPLRQIAPALLELVGG